MKRLRRYGALLAIVTLLCGFSAAALPGTRVFAADVLDPSIKTQNGSQDAIDCSGAAKNSAVCAEHTTTENPAPILIGKVIDIVTYVAGAAAVIVIIVSGLRYMTADGDSNKISSAKGTLVNTLVGLTIIVLSASLIKFVIRDL